MDSHPDTALVDLDRLVYAVGFSVEGQDEPEGHILHTAKLMARALCKEVKECFPSVKTFKFFISDENNFRKHISRERIYKGNKGPRS